MIELLALMEDLLKVPIDDAANSLFRTGIAGFSVKIQYLPFFYLSYIHEIVRVTQSNLRIIRITTDDVKFFKSILFG